MKKRVQRACMRCGAHFTFRYDETCPACRRVEANRGNPAAVHLVASWFAEHPLIIPSRVLVAMREAA